MSIGEEMMASSEAEYYAMETTIEETMICPDCNNKLEIKKGKYGEFVGCSNFPKCRFTFNKIGGGINE